MGKIEEFIKLARYHDDCIQSSAIREKFQDLTSDARTELAALRTQNAELLAALEPVAKNCPTWLLGWNVGLEEITGTEIVVFANKDLRRAAEVYRKASLSKL